ncbi:MAG: thioredoxin family protein [Bacteroidota bacterium]|nr:thioredoxin family protein [Bacteroidota bacterium]
MKRLLFFIVLVILIPAGCKTVKPAVEVHQADTQVKSIPQGTDFSKQETWILGYFNPARLSQPPYSEWYSKGFNEYKPDPAVIEKLSKVNKDDLSIKIVMGTWCPDSRREVPRFMQVLDQLKFPSDKLTFIGVDNEKHSPIGDYEYLNIQRVPTFIIMKNNVEAGRIIENPVASLEQDILNILNRSEK